MTVRIIIEEVGDKLIFTANNEARAWLAEIRARRGMWEAIQEMSAESDCNGGFHILDNDRAGFMTSSDIWGHGAIEDDDRYTIWGKAYADPLDYCWNQMERLFRHGRCELELVEDFGAGQTMPALGSEDYNKVQDYRYQTCVPHLAPPGLKPPDVDFTPPARE